jgi:multidrug efflux pump
VRLGDVAEVEDSVQDLRNAGFADGRTAVLLILNRQPGANIIEVVDSVRELLPRLRTMIAADVDLSVVMDRTPTIRASLNEVEHALALATVLVVTVVFLFLRNGARHAHPERGRAGVAARHASRSCRSLGFSLNNLSLMALTIATGFVVDDAVVVLENIARHIDAGEAARRGAEGRARSRLHRGLDEPVAGRGVHPHPADGRPGRAAAARIRGHAVGRPCWYRW